MTPIIYSLPYDAVGSLARNRVIHEYHDLTAQAGLQYRTFVLDHGYFYTDNVEIKDASGYNLLEDDFQCLVMSKEATLDTGLPTAAVVVILNPRVGHEVYINASMVGGPYCNINPAIAEMAAGLLNPTRKPTWRNIKNKPDKFEVGGHLHAMWELYGFEGYCNAIDRITDARMVISAKAYQTIREEYDIRMDGLELNLEQLMEDLRLHIAETNPHDVTVEQIALEKVQNYPIISVSEANQLGFSSLQRYLVPGRYKLVIDVNFTNFLTSHITNINNPHGVTAAQAGTRTIPETIVELNKKLGLYETAASANRVANNAYAAFYNLMRSNLNASEITTGIVNIQRICATAGIGADHGIIGNNQAVLLESAIVPLVKKGTKIVYLSGANGQNVAAVLANTYADISQYPVGTIALVMIRYYSNGSYGNGALIYDLWRLRAYTKVNSTAWSII